MEFPYEMAYACDPNNWTPVSEDELSDLLGPLAQKVRDGETITKDTVLYRKQR
jgi:hypothetical protein